MAWHSLMFNKGMYRKSKSKITYGKTFRTRKGRLGRYKYVNGRRVSFVSSRRRSYRMSAKARKSMKRYQRQRRYAERNW